MATFSVVIPAYNEEDGIGEIMQRVLATREKLREVGFDELELIVVDDGSKDRTAELVRAQPGAILVQHARNSGYGAALKTGFAAASGEWIGFLDADGTYPPEYFPALLQAAQQQRADLVIGSRMAGAESQMPLMRRIGNLIFARLVNLISASNITDSASGMRVFKKSILSQLYPLPDGLNLTPVMSTRALHENLKMVEAPIPYSERIGRSKLSVVRDGMRFGQSIVWTALNYNPARPFGLIGMVSFAIAALIGLGLIWVRLQGVQTVSPLGAFALFSALVLAVGGVMLIALGFSFNYFVALFHKTPVRQGLWGKPLFNVRWEHHFGWAGLVVLLIGIGFAIGSLTAALMGATLMQLWLYFLSSAVFSLMGLQLLVAWLQMQTLEALRIREDLAASDLLGKETMKPVAAGPVPVRSERLQPQP
ncbi:glycosyltransferase [Caldilinea sp.]|jgi:glycosyltransferase involved in cell wall biosynthesis|uniref:glycosyltransferase n=1 Tax=Caldilinea sp. TaxID=2293560 RepID=UPI0021DB84A6|nr:glycosyltransferase [Caldilinea sp.]GIV69590.1 MAG: glycosyl transferase [Caldilinea sp.]